MIEDLKRCVTFLLMLASKTSRFFYKVTNSILLSKIYRTHFLVKLQLGGKWLQILLIISHVNMALKVLSNEMDRAESRLI
jgi:hypothetical protein